MGFEPMPLSRLAPKASPNHSAKLVQYLAKKSPRRDSNPQSLPPEGSALSIRPQGPAGMGRTYVCRDTCIQLWWYSVVVSISGCDPLDPGSNPGTAILFVQKLPD